MDPVWLLLAFGGLPIQEPVPNPPCHFCPNPADALRFRSRCAEGKDARHESNGKFITYSYPPPLPIITTISRHLQWFQKLRVYSGNQSSFWLQPLSVTGPILEGSIPLETHRLIETEISLLASGGCWGGREWKPMGGIHDGRGWRRRSGVGGVCTVLLMVRELALTLGSAISWMRIVPPQEVQEVFLTHQVNKTCVCLMRIQILWLLKDFSAADAPWSCSDQFQSEFTNYTEACWLHYIYHTWEHCRLIHLLATFHNKSPFHLLMF